MVDHSHLLYNQTGQTEAAILCTFKAECLIFWLIISFVPWTNSNYDPYLLGAFEVSSWCESVNIITFPAHYLMFLYVTGAWWFPGFQQCFLDWFIKNDKELQEFVLYSPNSKTDCHSERWQKVCLSSSNSNSVWPAVFEKPKIEQVKILDFEGG